MSWLPSFSKVYIAVAVYCGFATSGMRPCVSACKPIAMLLRRSTPISLFWSTLILLADT